MAYVTVPESLPGIVGLLAQFPRTAQHLTALTQELLRGPSTLTAGERELIAAHVSSRNNCYFCTQSHSAAARELLGEAADAVDEVRLGQPSEHLSDKMQALLQVAGKVQQDGRSVEPEDIDAARAAGATDQELHDTVLIAAAFCMFNRYVDGLATWTPEDPALYAAQGRMLAAQGYMM